MVRHKLLTLVVVITLATIVASILFVVGYRLNGKPIPSSHPLPGAVIFPRVYYGFLSCNNYFIIIPGNSMVILHYHVHGNVTINGFAIYMAFPAGIINETLTAFSKLPNPNDALIMGVYVNGRLIASTNNPGPIQGLEFTVNNSNGHIAVGYTSDEVDFPPINLTSSDTLIVVIYSAVPYALPSCAVTNESEEVELMVKTHEVDVSRYIAEEPIIYMINTTSPINQLPRELTPSILAKARPFVTGYAPSFIMGYVQLPPYVKVGSNG